MASTQEFRRRIKSVNNTRQITKAMEMIASIKMQKAVKTAASLRSYVQNAWNMLELLAKMTSPESHPLLNAKESNRTAVILITSDRGLAGAYNSDVIRKLNQYIKTGVISSEVERSSEKISPTTTSGRNDNIDIIAIGKKGAEYVKRYQVGNLIAEFPALDEINYDEVIPIAKMAIDEYVKGTYGKVTVVYSHFVSSLKQTPVAKQVLPITTEHIDIPELWEPADVPLLNKERLGEVKGGEKSHGPSVEFKFEPNPDAVLERILPQFTRIQVYGAMIEANASEHSARMVAMKSATDSAGDLIDELKLVYNSVRQGNITREIAEISGAAEAMK